MVTIARSAHDRISVTETDPVTRTEEHAMIDLSSHPAVAMTIAAQGRSALEQQAAVRRLRHQAPSSSPSVWTRLAELFHGHADRPVVAHAELAPAAG